MSLQSLINSPLGIGLILTIGKIIPPRMGFSLADRTARFLTRKTQADFVRGARANQWVVTGESLAADALDDQVFENFRLTARILYDLYHNINDHDAIRQRVTISPKLTAFLENRIGAGEGTLLVAPHLSNFDMAGRAIVLHGFDVQALSYPRPPGGYQWQGGAVLTGIDRPVEDTNYHPRFFGYPTNLPTSYVRMALQTNSAIVVIACVGTPLEDYYVECSDLIYLEQVDDPVAEIEVNAEKVLAEMEPFIRAQPEQWAMTYPVWPFALDKMP